MNRVVLCVPTSVVDAYDTLLEGGVEKSQGIQPLLMYSSYVSCCIVSFCFRTLFVWLKRCENKLGPCCGCTLVLYHWGCVALERTMFIQIEVESNTVRQLHQILRFGSFPFYRKGCIVEIGSKWLLTWGTHGKNLCGKLASHFCWHAPSSVVSVYIFAKSLSLLANLGIPELEWSRLLCGKPPYIHL